MKRSILIVLLLAASAVTALAQSAPKSPAAECTLGEVQPLLKDAGPERVERTRRGPRDLMERTRLPNGATVQVSQGGCAHYGVRMVFSTTWRSSLQSGRPSRLITEALGDLNALKERTESPAVSDTIRLLAAHETEPYKAGEPLQDPRWPDVTVYVTGMDRGNSRRVEVTYSFVL